jgi:xylose isomerase
MSDAYEPKPEHKFTFGLWTVGNTGADAFGEPVRPKLSPADLVYLLGEVGAYGVNFHDNDLIPIDATPAKRDAILKSFKKALSDTGLVVPMATTNLFADPAFKDGAFTSNDPKVRAYALQKTMNAIDLGVEMGAKVYVCWGGREGAEVDAAKDPVEAIKRARDALDFLCEYVKDKGYDLKFALEAKPNEPRGHIYFSTTGNYLAFIETLKNKDMVGVNPEFAHETMAGLNFVHHVAQAMEAGKLFHVDLNSQQMNRYDQDFRFGQEMLKPSFYLVRLLEEGGYTGPRHFDAHALRVEDMDGVWDFAKGCMRTYLILKEKVQKMAEDKEIMGLIKELEVQDAQIEELRRDYTSEKAEKLKAMTFDPEALGRRPVPHEKLDQMINELLMGIR